LKYEVAKQWITALRSDEYPQCTNQLRQDGSYCCLGVLTDLFIKNNEVNAEARASWEAQGAYVDSEGVREAFSLPQDVIKWAGVKGSDPHTVYYSEDECEDSEQWATQLNDDEHWSFQQIANWVEENWEVL